MYFTQGSVFTVLGHQRLRALQEIQNVAQKMGLKENADACQLEILLMSFENITVFIAYFTFNWSGTHFQHQIWAVLTVP